MRNKTIKTGFTLVELLVSISVLSILLLISFGIYKSSTDRAKITSTKANMRLFQATVEMYAIDSNGLYPVSVDALKTEAKVEGYWKDFRNPVTNNIDPVTDLALATTVPAGGIGYRAGSTDPFLVGNSLTFVRRFAALAPVTATTTGTAITSYSIVGADPSGAIISGDNGSIFVLTNGDYKPSTNPSTQPSATPSVIPTPNNYNPDDYTKPEEAENKEKKANEDKKYNDEADKLKEDLNKKADEIAKRRNEDDKNKQKQREEEDKLKAERRKEEDKKRIEKWKEEDKKRNERRADNDKKLKPAELKAANEKRKKADEKRAEKRDELEKTIQEKRDGVDKSLEEKRKSIDNQIELLRKEYDRKIQQKNAVSDLKNTEDNKSSEDNSNNKKKD